MSYSPNAQEVKVDLCEDTPRLGHGSERSLLHLQPVGFPVIPGGSSWRRRDERVEEAWLGVIKDEDEGGG